MVFKKEISGQPTKYGFQISLGKFGHLAEYAIIDVAYHPEQGTTKLTRSAEGIAFAELAIQDPQGKVMLDFFRILEGPENLYTVVHDLSVGNVNWREEEFQEPKLRQIIESYASASKANSN